MNGSVAVPPRSQKTRHTASRPQTAGKTLPAGKGPVPSQKISADENGNPLIKKIEKRVPKPPVHYKLSHARLERHVITNGVAIAKKLGLDPKLVDTDTFQRIVQNNSNELAAILSSYNLYGDSLIIPPSKAESFLPIDDSSKRASDIKATYHKFASDLNCEDYKFTTEKAKPQKKVVQQQSSSGDE